MQGTSETKQLLVGLPKAGKTTFLAALWHVVESGEVEGSLRLSRLHGEREHLNNICKDWLGCQRLERTLISTEKIVSMELVDPVQGSVTELILPDLSGESFKNEWETREWSKEFDTLASESTGALLFIHPEEVVQAVRIGPDVDRLVSAVELNKGNGKGVDQEPVPWTHDLAPTQTKLVDLLQFFMTLPFRSRTLRLAVVISAWDLVIKREPQYKNSPSTWLATQLPFLDQFLKSNDPDCMSRIYGVSAQGGDLGDSKKLLKKTRPSERIIVVGPQCRKHDITAPIRWIME